MTDPTRTRKRATRPAGPPVDRTPVCRCVGGPLTMATFRAVRPGADSELAFVERLHWTARDGYPMPAERLTPKEWRRS